MTSNPKAIGDFINGVIAGWEEHAPDATFGGLTLAQYKTKVKPSLDAREVSSLELKLDAARVDRDNADVVSDEITNNVVNSAKGDPNFGENSALYASFGYIRKDDRKSGLTRAANNVVPAPRRVESRCVSDEPRTDQRPDQIGWFGLLLFNDLTRLRRVKTDWAMETQAFPVLFGQNR